MSDKKNNYVNYCVYCGANITKGKVYCPNCGRLVIELKSNVESTIKKPNVDRKSIPEKKTFSRKCSGCGSVINSIVLEQCPICNSLLEPLPEKNITETSFVFMREKLEPTQKINPDIWEIKEGFNVFMTSLLTYFMVYTFIVMLLIYQIDQNNTYSDIFIYLIILSQIPSIIFGIYPLYYIVTRKHSFEKLGFPLQDKKIHLALFIGVLGGLGLIGINILSSYLNVIFYDLGLNFFDIQEYLDTETRAIKRAGFWIFVLLAELIFAAISVEIVFRGVLHNTLREKFGKENKKSKILTIIIVASIYSGIYLMFSFPIGIFFIIPNFLVFVLLGLLYEINGNIYNSIIASIFYNVILILMIFSL